MTKLYQIVKLRLLFCQNVLLKLCKCVNLQVFANIGRKYAKGESRITKSSVNREVHDAIDYLHTGKKTEDTTIFYLLFCKIAVKSLEINSLSWNVQGFDGIEVLLFPDEQSEKFRERKQFLIRFFFAMRVAWSRDQLYFTVSEETLSYLAVPFLK